MRDDVEEPRFHHTGKLLEVERKGRGRILAGVARETLFAREVPVAEEMDRAEDVIERKSREQLARRILVPREVIRLDAELDDDAAPVALPERKHRFDVPRELFRGHRVVGVGIDDLRQVVAEADLDEPFLERGLDVLDELAGSVAAEVAVQVVVDHN